ncbi:MAG: U32 family peptidase, partial [Clostridia bacterium]|nr:U32 family peptidase [Clostridia bacterium]
MVNKPELLAPAGSFEALKAAISAGADAVYFGATSFNARNRAENFNHEELEQAIRLCRIHGVKTNITVNTQLLDREIPDGLNLIGDLLRMGADAFIIADLGLATAVKQKYPQAIIHASTQASGQNVISAKALQSIGFSRMVAPRELSFEDIKILTENSPIEIEIFVHGALCMSFSGQCLMSS